METIDYLEMYDKENSLSMQLKCFFFCLFVLPILIFIKYLFSACVCQQCSRDVSWNTLCIKEQNQ